MKRLLIFYLLIIFSLFSQQHLLSSKILLTGGAGFIGSHVSEKLLKRGDTVIVVDSLNNSYNNKQQYNCKHISKYDTHDRLCFFKKDIRNLKELKNIIKEKRPDVICHLAAQTGVRKSIEMPEEYVTSNIIGTLNIFELAKTFTINHVVYASSSSAYGNLTQGPFSEDLPTNKPISPYAVTKITGELLAYTYYHLYGISSTGLRFFTVYGPRGRIDMAPFIFMDAIHNKKPITVYGDGSAVRDFTYIDDIVNGIVMAIDKPLGFEVINLGRSKPEVLNDFIQTIETVVEKKAIITYKPAKETDVTMTHADTSKSKKLLGYNPKIDIQDGIKRMYEWYKNEYIIEERP